MSVKVKGVVARAKGAPVTLETVIVPDPGRARRAVKVQACGVCHTDLHYREGAINDEFPFLLGHEAAGIVESVGPDVTDLAPGDYVILNWRAVCGDCRACRRGRPQYCFATFNATQKMTLEDGTELSAALGIGAFVEKTLVAAGQCTKVDPAAPPEVAGLLGCGVMAGLGAAINTGNVRRGDSVAVIGCGGVGDARDRRRPARRRPQDHRGRHRRPEAGAGQGVRRHRTPSTPGRPTRSRRSRTLTERQRRRRRDRGDRAARRPTSRRSTPATSPAPSCSSAYPTPRCASSCRSSTSSAAAAH